MLPPVRNNTKPGNETFSRTTPAMKSSTKPIKGTSRNKTKRVWPRDNCASDQFCQSYVGGSNPLRGPETMSQKGYCCPRPPATCPAGNRLASSDSSCNNCPKDLYFCYTDSATGGLACCPKPCATGDVYVNGQCYPQVALGLQCLVNDQCTDSNSRCGAISGGSKT